MQLEKNEPTMENPLMRRILTLATLALAAIALPARAASDLDLLQNLGQTQFRLLSEDLGAALSYKAVLPAEPLGTAGFDLGVEVTVVNLENSAILELATSGDAPDSVAVPKLHVHKGLPFGIDIGAFVATVPDSNVSLWGAEVRYAILKGGTATPAVAVRGSYSSLEGVDQLKLNTTGLDISISKGFTFLTPYAGVGKVWVRSTPDQAVTAVSGVVAEDFNLTKYFVGLNMNFAFVNFALEGDRTGDTTSYSAKLGWRF
jgi:hypothetical protein